MMNCLISNLYLIRNIRYYKLITAMIINFQPTIILSYFNFFLVLCYNFYLFEC